MEIISSIFDFILNDLGSTIFLPALMMILGLLVGMKFLKSFSSAITFGVALAGMSLVIGYMTGAISPAAEAMTKSLGKTFNIVDGGWVTLASITWSWKYAFLLFPFQIGINLIMFVTRRTKTINVDLWNVWGKIFQCIVIKAITGSMVLGFVVAGVRIVLELILGDALQPRILEKSGLPGVTCPHSLMLFGAVLYPLDMLLRKIPALEKNQIDAAYLKEKIGVFAENHVMGFILGILFGVIARYDIPASLMLGITCATAMTLLPMATKIFMQALAPISDACTTFMKKHSKGREVLIGLDAPIILGNAEIWVSCMITIPFTLLWAVILPWNSMLPFAGIVNLALALAAFYVCNGNIVRMLILMIFVGSPIFLLCGTALAPMIPDLAVQNGFIEVGTMVSNSALDAPVFCYAFSFIFEITKGNFLPLIAAAYFMFGYVVMVRDLKKIYRKKDEAETAKVDAESLKA